MFEGLHQPQATLKAALAPTCPHAEELKGIAEQYYQEVANRPTAIEINIRVLRLTRKYLQGRGRISPSHRKLFGSKHICVTEVFEEYGQKLLDLEIHVNERFQFLDPQPQPQPVYITKNYVYDGFPIGDTTVDDEETG